MGQVGIQIQWSTRWEAIRLAPEIARGAPYTTPVRRLDEVTAAKRPVIRETLA